MSLASKTVSVVFVGAALTLVAVAASATPPASGTRPPAATTAPASPTPTTRPPTTTPATPAPSTAAPIAPRPTTPGPTTAAPATPAPTPGLLLDVSEARLALARQVVRNGPQLGNFDGILPDLMVDAETRLISLRPDLYKDIAVVAEAQASALVARRTDLDNDIARVWARSFTDDELRAINAFFTSPAGVKYKAVAPQVGNDILKAGQNWADRLASELFDRTLAELRKKYPKF